MKIEPIRLALLGLEAASDLWSITESPFGIGSFIEAGNLQVVVWYR